eukprot:9288699-Pyramimonas_sp.AAC.1
MSQPTTMHILTDGSHRWARCMDDAWAFALVAEDELDLEFVCYTGASSIRSAMELTGDEHFGSTTAETIAIWHKTLTITSGFRDLITYYALRQAKPCTCMTLAFDMPSLTKQTPGTRWPAHWPRLSRRGRHAHFPEKWWI